jgi:hypothetical protein
MFAVSVLEFYGVQNFDSVFLLLWIEALCAN